MLADYLQRRRSVVPDWESARVLEVGAGTGLVATTVAMLGASLVVATDGDAAVLPLLQRNIVDNTNNTNTTVVDVRQLQWGSASPDLAPLREAHPGGFSLVLGADVAFEHDSSKRRKGADAALHRADGAFRSLVETLEAVAPTPRTRILIAHKQRYNREARFFDMMARSFVRRKLGRRWMHPDFRTSNVQLYEFVRRPSGGGV